MFLIYQEIFANFYPKSRIYMIVTVKTKWKE